MPRSSINRYTITSLLLPDTRRMLRELPLDCKRPGHRRGDSRQRDTPRDGGQANALPVRTAQSTGMHVPARAPAGTKAPAQE